MSIAFKSKNAIGEPNKEYFGGLVGQKPECGGLRVNGWWEF